MRNGSWSTVVMAVAVALGLLAGCQTESQRVPPQNLGVARNEGRQSLDIHQLDAKAQPVIPTGPDNRDVNPDSLTDPCAARLHDISGALLLYYVSHHQMPPALEDLKPLADVGSELQFSCARNGAPFVYVPDGMAAQGKEKRIIAYDPTPIGRPRFRWCLMASVSKSGAIATDVVPLAENVFNTYHTGAPAVQQEQQPQQPTAPAPLNQ